MPELKRNTKKIVKGVVVSDKMDNTIVVKVDRSKKHRLYKKAVIISKKYKADNPDNKAKLGDIVEIIECRPLSKTKSFRLFNIVSKKQREYASATVEAKDYEKNEDAALDKLHEKHAPEVVASKTDDEETSIETKE
jgi:small subunit ribosomal protein S17